MSAAGFFDASFFDPRRHGEALARLASGHLGRGDFAAAFRYADRNCRLFKAGAREYLLRSEASRRSGHAEFAAQDLALALEADPTDPLVKTLALSWGSDVQKQQAARSIIADGDGDRLTLQRAIGHLFGKDDAQILSGLTRRDGILAGWIAWVGSGAFSLRIEAATTQVFDIAPDPVHDLAGAFWSCVEIEAPCAEGETLRLVFMLDGRVLDTFSSPPLRKHEGGQGGPAATDSRLKPEQLNVIVPVYEDFAATRACLDAIFVETSKIALRLIVIDDASPNPGLRDWLDLQAASRKIELIRNERNLGFAVSVNRALTLCPDGDVLLLNADTLPPPSVLDRLVEVAYSKPDIGTVTPLSNNGELTNFPKPHVVNTLGSPEEVARLDALALQANGAASVDLPNGVGFCLYITRACLDAVGPLPEIYARGYYEDVEFCLRAREKGFRNVCAVGIYVGHAGARSFGVEKRRLVMRNLKALKQRFPGNSLECAAFVHADPLKPWRRAIEALAPPQDSMALLVCGEGASSLLAREESLRRGEVSGQPNSLICLYEQSGDRVFLSGIGDLGPHSLSFSLRDEEETKALIAWLRCVDLVRIEIFDPLKLPKKLLKIMSMLRRPIELVAAGADWVFASHPPAAGPCGDSRAGPCAACAVASPPGKAEPSRAFQLKRRRTLVAGARAIRPLDRMSDIFARQVFGDAVVMEPPELLGAEDWAPRAKNAAGALAIVVPEPSALADRLIVSLGRALSLRGFTSRSCPIVVLGQCLDDLAVMACGNVFVAGKIETEEYQRMLRQYEVSALMSPYRTLFFGRIDHLSQISGLPKAYFDWTFGKMSPMATDLALDPRLCDAKAVAQIADWFRRGTEAQ
jgi:GT2 family glycosyltransferase